VKGSSGELPLNINNSLFLIKLLTYVDSQCVQKLFTGIGNGVL
jgi:hypothetical protein